MQFFVLDQFSSIKRYALEEIVFSDSAEMPLDEIDAVPWLLGW